MTLFLQYAIDALNVGGLYALMALGIGLIFGIMRLINFAHGEIVMAGAYAMWLVVEMPTPVVIAFSIVVVALISLGIERAAFRPLREVSPATLLIAAFAVSYFLQNLAVMLFVEQVGRPPQAPGSPIRTCITNNPQKPRAGVATAERIEVAKRA